jgi:hypothetical protein
VPPGRSLVAICPECKKHVVASEEQHMIYNDGPAAPHWRFSLVTCGECGHGMVLYEEDDPYRDTFDDPIWLYPLPPASEGSATPPALRSAMREARLCLSVGATSAAAVMAGRVIEGVAHEHGIRGKTLHEAVKDMSRQEILDGRFAIWVDQLRILRNRAAHYSQRVVTIEDAEDIVALTDAVLTYLYVFRGRFDAFMLRHKS